MSETFESKTQVMEREQQRMQRELSGGNWTDRERVALTCRILCSHGHESGLAGQITARESDGESDGVFLTQRLGCGFREVTASGLLRVDEELNVLSGVGMPNPANRFHAWVYRARPDVRCIVHTHPLYTSALSMLGVPLVISHMDTCALFDNVAFLGHWPGVPVGNEEGQIISTALGEKSALLLAHHGALIASASVAEACVLAVQFERAAQLFMLARAAGEVRAIEPDKGREARGWLLTPRRIEATFAYYARRELSTDPDCLT
jgi:L-fuculose-phosphate aldolase